ncbi:unnamed protein product [Linum tenue]|uniref:Uncharacterized protein n=1 Tax=Linum tenue TaxID=586396 RepID=A0AAV0HRJ4_9ROSI|nr:unnamed protein product [Linum tenue]
MGLSRRNQKLESRGYLNDGTEQNRGGRFGGIVNRPRTPLSLQISYNDPSSQSSSYVAAASPSAIQYQNFLPQHHHHHAVAAPSSVAFNFDDRRLDFVDLSLGSSSDADPDLHRGAGPSSTAMPIEKEHMFDKVVTPSDVGKLNRLVIPKQHAEM